MKGTVMDPRKAYVLFYTKIDLVLPARDRLNGDGKLIVDFYSIGWHCLNPMLLILVKWVERLMTPLA
jgi:hypothetical protein